MKVNHLENGNYYDNMLIDIDDAYRKLNLLPSKNKKIYNHKYRNLTKLFITKKIIKYGLYEPLVTTGVIKNWFIDFKDYWSNFLNGRPIHLTDFFLLLHDYRKKIQHTSALQWDNEKEHIKNWQNPANLYLTLHNTRRVALNPLIGESIVTLFKSNSKILEYGCSIAPYYWTYREFFNHLDCEWILADIPNFPYNYAKYRFMHDDNTKCIIIGADDFVNPLGCETNFDIIIITTVFEHLDNPLFVAKYLLDRLNTGGMFVFDYIKTDGIGLDHPNAVAGRAECLEYLMTKLDIIKGNAADITRSISTCVGIKRSR